MSSPESARQGLNDFDTKAKHAHSMRRGERRADCYSKGNSETGVGYVRSLRRKQFAPST